MNETLHEEPEQVSTDTPVIKNVLLEKGRKLRKLLSQEPGNIHACKELESINNQLRKIR